MGKRTAEPSDLEGEAAPPPGEGARPARAESVAALRDPASRRRFMALVGGTGAAAALATLVSACGGEEEPEDTRAPTRPDTDLDIANFALYLEYLEQDFYKQVVDSGQLRAEYETLAEQTRLNETEHVQALEGLVRQIGAAEPVPRPVPNFDAVIEAGEQRILETAATLENLGAAAYLGQATNIENNLFLAAALNIHTVEARHAAAFNEIAGNDFVGGAPLNGSIPDGAFAKPMRREQVLEEAAAYVRA
jgi:Ferritin-like domain